MFDQHNVINQVYPVGIGSFLMLYNIESFILENNNGPIHCYNFLYFSKCWKSKV